MMSGAVGPARTSAPLWFSVALVVYAGLAAAYVGLWVKMARADAFRKADFSAFYTRWEMVLEGEADRLYDPERQQVYQTRLGLSPEERLPYPFLPHRWVVLAPLALLTPRDAFYVWTGFQLVLVVVLAGLLRRLTADWLGREHALLVVTVLAFPPLWMNFVLGQASLLVAVCLLGFYLALQRGEAFLAALCLVLGTIEPQLVLVPAVTLLATRRWRELGIAAGLLAAWAATTAWVLGWEVWPTFLGVLRSSASVQPFNPQGSLTALLGPWQADLILVLSGVGLLFTVVATVWVWRGPWEPRSPRFELRAGLTLMLGLIVTPPFFPHGALALIVPVVLFLVYQRRVGLPQGGVVALALCGPLLFWLDRFVMDSWPGGVRPFFLVMLVAAAWMGRAWVREERGRIPPGLEEV